MKLASCQDRIQSGDVLLVEGRASLFSWLIRLGTLSRFTHTGFAIWVDFGQRERLCVFESIEGFGVHMYPLDRYLEDRNRKGERVHWYQINSRVINRRRLCDFLHQAWGRRYVTFRQFVVLFGWWTGCWQRLLGSKPRDLDPGRYFCSELVAEALQHAGWKPDSCCPRLPAVTSPEQVSLITVLQHKGVLE